MKTAAVWGVIGIYVDDKAQVLLNGVLNEKKFQSSNLSRIELWKTLKNAQNGQIIFKFRDKHRTILDQ